MALGKGSLFFERLGQTSPTHIFAAHIEMWFVAAFKEQNTYTASGKVSSVLFFS